MPSVRWRAGRASGSEEEVEAGFPAGSAVAPPLPPPPYAPPARGRIPWRRLAETLALLTLAALALGPRAGPRLRAASYGGLVGRTWTLRSFHEVVLAVGRLGASNLAGLEEEGWLTGVFHDTVVREHGESCTSRLGAVPRSDGNDGGGGGGGGGGDSLGDLAPCPCLAIPRAGLPPPGTPDPPVPFFYLKLHKVGSTTVTSALVVRCVEGQLAEAARVARRESHHRPAPAGQPNQTLPRLGGAIWRQVVRQNALFGDVTKLPRRGEPHFDGDDAEAKRFAALLKATPAALEACRQLPLRVSHNSIASYVDAGKCAASASLAACALSFGDRDTWFDWQEGSRASEALALADSALALASGATDREATLAAEQGRHALAAVKGPYAVAAFAAASSAAASAAAVPGRPGPSGQAAALPPLAAAVPSDNPWRLARSLVVVRRPVDRFVSSLYFWNCERGTFPAVRRMLLATPPANLTGAHLATVRAVVAWVWAARRVRTDCKLLIQGTCQHKLATAYPDAAATADNARFFCIMLCLL